MRSVRGSRVCSKPFESLIKAMRLGAMGYSLHDSRHDVAKTVIAATQYGGPRGLPLKTARNEKPMALKYIIDV